MTREEAFKHLRNDWFMSLGGQLCVDEDKKDAFLEAVGMGIKALRPVSREQVEQVWGGCEWCDEEWGTCNPITNRFTMPPRGGIRFCPMCGKPLTDEAVEMVMERLEALYEQ